MAKTKVQASNAPADPPNLLTARALALLLDTTREAVYQRVQRGDIPASCVVRLGHRLRFRTDAVTAWIDSMTGKVAA